METVLDTLQTVSFFRNVARAQLEKSAPLWAFRTLAPGEDLWRQGDPVDEMAIVLSGELQIIMDHAELGKLGAGELIGEASVFLADSTRSTSLRARFPVRLLRLSVDGLKLLRAEGSDVYRALLDQALSTLSRRVRNTNLHIAQVTKGHVDAPSRHEPGLLARLWKSYKPVGYRDPLPRLELLLRRLPGLSNVSAATLKTLSTAFEPLWMDEGQVIFLEGDVGTAAYVIAEGEVDVLRHVRGERAEPLARLKRGDQFGLNTLVEPGNRTASCVCVKMGWLYRMDAAAYAALSPDARLLWDENILSSFASQIRNANKVLRRYLTYDIRAKRAAIAQESIARKIRQTPLTNPVLEARLQRAEVSVQTANARKEDAFEKLLRASGYLEALPVSRKELGTVKVVTSEDMKRAKK